jgi:hypothetical protein
MMRVRRLPPCEVSCDTRCSIEDGSPAPANIRLANMQLDHSNHRHQQHQHQHQQQQQQQQEQQLQPWQDEQPSLNASHIDMSFHLDDSNAALAAGP